MSKKRNKWPNELKESIVEVYMKQGKSFALLSKEYNIPIPTINSWVQKKRLKNNPQKMELFSKDEEIKKLKWQLADVTEERDILKKVAAIFSRDQKN